LLRRSALLDDKLVKAELLRGALEHALLDGLFRDEPVHIDLFGLTDAVRAIHCLEVSLRVPARHMSVSHSDMRAWKSRPIRVVEDHDIRGREVDTEPTSARGEEKDELFRVGLVVLVDTRNTVLVRGAAVDAAVL
jgi:hypothetical protein